MLGFNFGFWEFWEAYEPDDGTFGPQKVTFDGVNKLILINEPETEIDFRIDVYSNWKEWKQTQVNSKFLQALAVVGGDPLPGNLVLGSTFFLENGWRIRSWEGDQILSIVGNVFTREGDDPVLPPLGDFKITVNFVVSTLVEGGRAVGAELGIDSVLELDELWRLAGLDADAALVVDPDSRTAGTNINQTIDKDEGTDTVTITRSGTDPVPGA